MKRLILLLPPMSDITFSVSENDDEWEAYLKSLEEMDNTSGKQDLVEEEHQETICLQNKYINGERMTELHPKPCEDKE
jgi:hypothetical protein